MTKQELVKSNSDLVTQADKVPQKRGCFGIFFALGGVFMAVLYLLNLSGGFIEIPDNIPIIGNIDEVGMSAFLFACLRYLGIDVIPFKKK